MTSKKIITSIACYKEDQYQLLRSYSSDWEAMHDTWEEWFNEKEKVKKELIKQGLKVREVEVDVFELLEYCSKNELPNNGATRSNYANYLTMNKIK